MKKWFKRSVAGLLIMLAGSFGTLSVLILNPGWAYAHQTQIGQCRVFHQESLPAGFEDRLLDALAIIRQSPLYEQDYLIKLCLEDGASYPDLVRKFVGSPRGVSYGNVALIFREFHVAENYSLLNGKQWNFTELLAHELTHCLQANKFGIPMLRKPTWKIEGYAEYVARRAVHTSNLRQNYQKWLAAKSAGLTQWDMVFLEGEMGVGIDYFHYMLGVQFYLEVKEIPYIELMEKDELGKNWQEELADWYELEAEI
ncbi:MAG: hypothetical protein AAFR61_31400 [Bacteroidota bacterium]